MFRKSKQREAILKVIKKTTCHPDATWIYEQVRKEIPNISLGTVYRNLKCLKQDGEIMELQSGSLSRFDGNVINHYHFKCDQCHQIYDIDLELAKTINNEVARWTGFKVTHISLIFSGVCNRCLKISH